MTSGPKIAVIGGGAAGLSAAMHTAELGFSDVTVFEAFHPAEGSSGLSAGIFNRQTNKPDELEMRAYSVRGLERFATENGYELVRSGYVRIAKTDEQLAGYERARDLQKELGVRSKVINRRELAELVPGMLVDDLVGGLYGPDDGHLDGHMLCGVFRERGAALGVKLRNRTVITHAEEVGSQIVLAGEDGPLGTFDIVVNAAGPNAGAIAGLLGVTQHVVNERHQICTLKSAKKDRRIPAVQTYVPGSGEEAIWVRPEGPGTFLTGLHTQEIRSGTTGEHPFEFRRKVDDNYIEAVAEAFDHRMPGWDDVGIAGGWSGLYPVSPDGRFQVGPYQNKPNVVAVGGLGGVGLTNSYAVGRIAAEWIVNGEPTVFPFAKELVPDRASLTETAPTV
ncbi:MAG: FAD-binding oxidoreductase [Hyphomicrobiales bacterium]|nr:MAG: FAD-binding oxidoreductase [Hyphomicrobiales bacterium]